MRLPARLTPPLLLLLALACSSQPARLRGAPDGIWLGTASYRGARLEFSVHFRSDGDTLRATFNSPDLLLLGQPLDSVGFTPPHVRFTTPDDHPVRFDAVLAGDSLVGTMQVGAVPGVIEPGTDATDGPRFTLRHAVVPPPPYGTKRVSFGSDTTQLGGTLYLPSGMPHTLPGVVILQGSTANLRHEYRFYADHFARAGFAVLVFDKRGHGESGGDYGTATYEDLADDATAAVKRLRAEPQVVSSRVGIWGLSQGAFIAPLVAQRVDSLAFVVAVSPPGTVIGLAAAYQDSVRLVSAGFDLDDAQHAAELGRRISDWLAHGHDRERLEDELDRVHDTAWRRASSLPHHLPRGATLESWYWRGRTLDPLPGWRALKVPALVVFGAADELLPAGISAAAIERALGQGASADHTVKVFASANHTLRMLPLVAGGKWDWPRAAPGYVDLVTRWMLAYAQPPGR